ncbi:hypothetical protein [Pseudoalteromonas rubra]|uniref:hypothetical protein n=1 Tax=Pseudoalteromonas rubra TaxID=43658 RepID=UPI0013DE3A4A|nr:hypothetical protein [Pseudoalteromonas rubra]
MKNTLRLLTVTAVMFLTTSEWHTQPDTDAHFNQTADGNVVFCTPYPYCKDRYAAQI